MGAAAVQGGPGASCGARPHLGARKALMRASASGGAEYCMIQAWSSSSVTAALLVAACAPAPAQTCCPQCSSPCGTRHSALWQLGDVVTDHKYVSGLEPMKR